MFSHRLPASFEKNPLTLALEKRKAAGLPVIDLTLSNPTTARFDYPVDSLKEIFSRAVDGVYEPDARGLLKAREAICAHHARRGVAVNPQNIHLTAGTSEAYAHLFKILCDAGDAVLLPEPSYPLFESLAALESVHAERFQFVYTTEGTTEGWRLDRASFEKAAKTKNARAALFVHPNNPTGALLRADDWAFIKAICAEHKIAIIVDEVFLDYAEQSADTLGTTAGEKGAGTLVFTLNGLSKTAALPQLKLSWIVTSGPGELVAQALERLDVVNDAFLSCASPVQNALGDLLKIGENLRAQISARLKENSALLETLTLPQNTHVLKRDGGWYAVLRLPDHILEEPFCLKLLKQHGVLAHPGFFYDFPAAQAHLVLSLLPKSAQFATAIRTILPP